MECHGVPVYVISNGRVCLDEDGLHVTTGVGRFIDMPAFPEIAYNKIRCRDEVCKPQGVDREPYTGPVIDLSGLKMEEATNGTGITHHNGDSIVHRPPTRGGTRNMQESSFALSD